MKLKKKKKPSHPKSEENEDVFDIDEYSDLVRAWSTQSKLVLMYGKLYSVARRDHSREKRILKTKIAELGRKMRDDPQKYGFEGKASETGIAAIIPAAKGIIAQEDLIIDCKYAVDILEAWMTALEDRKKQLENMVTLHGRQYFASPRETDSKGSKHLSKKAVRRKGQG